MEKLKKNKFVLGIIVLSTVVLSIVAAVTAYKLYQLKDETVAPNVPSGDVYAFSCEEYQLLVDTDGTIRISNVSGESQPSQTIDIIVGGQSLGSFTIPALDPQTNADIGGINLPAGDFNWNIDGDILCAGDQSGTLHEGKGCNPFSVKLASAQTITTPTPTQTPTPTDLPRGGTDPTPTPTPTVTATNPTNTPTPTSVNNVSNNTPTPALPTSQISQLPDTGSVSATLFVILISVFSLLGGGFILLKSNK